MKTRLGLLGWLMVFFTVASAQAENRAAAFDELESRLRAQREILSAQIALQDARAQLEQVSATTDYVRAVMEHAISDGTARVESYGETRQGREQEVRRQARSLYKLARGGLLRLAFERDRDSMASRIQRARLLRWLIDHDVHELAVHQRAESRARSELMLTAHELEGLAAFEWSQGLQSAILSAVSGRLEARLQSEQDHSDMADRPSTAEARAHLGEIAKLRRSVQRGPRHRLLVRGGLSWPALGHVVHGLGRDDNGGVGSFRRGVEIAVGRRTLVRAPASGRVIYVGDLPGRGRGVILDHGAGFRSITGPLGSIEVREGSEVEAGTVLGRTPQRSLNGKILYFELRHGERPIDPVPYFSAVAPEAVAERLGREVAG